MLSNHAALALVLEEAAANITVTPPHYSAAMQHFWTRSSQKAACDYLCMHVCMTDELNREGSQQRHTTQVAVLM